MKASVQNLSLRPGLFHNLNQVEGIISKCRELYDETGVNVVGIIRRWGIWI